MAKILITRNRPYSMEITIKEPFSLTPITLDPADVVTMHIKEKGKRGALLVSKELTHNADPSTGKFVLSLTALETKLLVAEIGFAEDSEPWRATCKGHISIDTAVANVGDVIIPDIYVADIGIPEAV